MYTTCLFIIKYLNNQLPDVCKCFLVVNNPNNAVYDFRTISKFVIPKYRTNIREKFIKCYGPNVWNRLPENLYSVSSDLVFKSRLKYYIIHSNIDFV